MSNFFGFEDHVNHCYTVINIDKIVSITKEIVTNKDFRTETKVLMYVEFGKDVKMYHLTEAQYYKLNNIIKHNVLV
jgi:hypothetical protein